MMKMLCLMSAIAVSCTGCASERLRVFVTDCDGHPISNATVDVSFTAGHVVFGKGKSHHYKGTTGNDGKAIVEFNCASSDVHWSVEAYGYYPSDFYKEVFLIEVVPILPIFYKVNMLEHEKEGKATLWKKRNPQPMITHGVSYVEDQHLIPEENGRYGFDMMKYDWLPPRGKGEIADFYFVRCFGEDVPDGVVGWLEFPDKCGMYTGKQTGCKIFPSTYEANTNAVFKSRIPFIFNHTDDGQKAITYRDIVNENEYGVLRTRVVCDEAGNIVKANYAKVLGPFRIGEAYKGFVMYTPCAVFNPRVNDPNLESDPEHSYDPKVKRPLLAP